MDFLIALGVALAITPIAGWAGRRAGLVDPSGDPLKIHMRPVPAAGGVAVVVALLVVARPPAAATAGIVAALAAGLIDDVKPQPPAVRLVLLAVAGSLIGTSVGAGAVGMVVGIGLVLLCSTSVNMIDGQDGLASGLGAISAAALALVASRLGIAGAYGAGLALTGALVGFLPWNFPRARIFLGNGGAYAAGAALAYIATLVVAGDGWHGLILSGACLGVFALEFGTTFLRRLASRSPLTGGDRFHSYDLLAVRLSSRRAVTVAFWGFGLLLAISAIVLVELPRSSAILGAAAGWGAGIAAAVIATRAAGEPVGGS